MDLDFQFDIPVPEAQDTIKDKIARWISLDYDAANIGRALAIKNLWISLTEGAYATTIENQDQAI